MENKSSFWNLKRSYFLICSLLLFSGCDSNQPQEEEVRFVDSVILEPIVREEIILFSGFSKAGKIIDSSFRVEGLLEDFPVKVGDLLKQGDLIAQLDRRDFQLKLDQAKASYEEAIAESRNATAQYRRIKLLYESESASRNELDSARAAHEAANAAVVQSKAAVELAYKQLSYTTLRTERDDCVIANKLVEENQNVTAGQTIVTMTCGKEIEVEIAVPESQIANVNRGMKMNIEFNAIPNRHYTGTVTEVGNVASQATTFPVTVALDGIHQELRSGMAAKVYYSTQLDEGEKMLLAPSVAVGEDRSGNFVYLLEPINEQFGIARKKKVEVGMISTKGIEIKSGVQAGDRLITAGIRYLWDGRKVRIKG